MAQHTITTSKRGPLACSLIGCAVALTPLLAACGNAPSQEQVQSSTFEADRISCDKPPGPRGLRHVYVRDFAGTPSVTGLPTLSRLNTRIVSITQVAAGAAQRQIVGALAVEDTSYWSLATADGSALVNGSTFSVLYEPTSSAAASTSQALTWGAPAVELSPFAEPAWEDPGAYPEPPSSEIADDDRPVEISSHFDHVASKDNIVGNETCLADNEAAVDPNAFLVVTAKRGAASARYVSGASSSWCIAWDDSSQSLLAGDSFSVDVYVSSAAKQCAPVESK